MNDQRYLEAMVNAQQVQVGITVAASLGVMLWVKDGFGGERRLVGPDDVMLALRNNAQIIVTDPVKVLSTSPGVQIGDTSRRWIQRGDYAQAVQLLGAQTIDVMRQVLGRGS